MEGTQHPQAYSESYPLSSGISSDGTLSTPEEEALYVHGNAWPFPSHYQAEFANPALYHEMPLHDTSPRSSTSGHIDTHMQYDPYAPTSSLEDHMNNVMYKQSYQDSQVPDPFAQRRASPTSVPASFAIRSTSSEYPPNLDPQPQHNVNVTQILSHERSQPTPLKVESDVYVSASKGRPRQEGTRPSGACARCRRLKMKCTFNDSDASMCSRCSTGGHECIFPGRKPRAPGLRTVLRQQIREKDAMIDVLLNQVNPGPTVATPLTLVPSRLSLTPAERTAHRDVLSWLEKAATPNTSKSAAELSKRFEIATLEDDDDLDSDDDEDEDDDKDGFRTSPSGPSHRIQTLLEETTPAGLLANASLQQARAAVGPTPPGTNSDGSSSKETASAELGPGSENYFLPGPAANLELRRLIVERQAAPDILLSGLVTPDDVTKLFQIYYQWINPLMYFLDENIHTPAAVLGRDPFLFTVVCAISARYYDEKPHIHGMAMHFARASAANAIIDGWKTIEMCQAFALLSVYNPPARRWEEDRGWCFTGIAFRLATELNLSRAPKGKPANEREEREVLNQTRAWITCYVMDRCMSIQLGKPWMIPEDQTVRNASTWCTSSKYQGRGDIFVASLVELLCIMSGFVSTVNPAFELTSRPTRAFEYTTVQKMYDDELTAWRRKFEARYETDDGKDVSVTMQKTLIQSVYHYTRLVIFSYGIQQISRKGVVKESSVCFMGCLQAASAVINVMIEKFVPTGFIRYVPELVFAQTAFASAVLLKCLRPEFKELLDRTQEERIVQLNKRLYETWTSDNIATDDNHTSKIYARLIKQLVDPHISRLQQTSAHSESTELNSPSDVSTSPTSSLPEISPYAERAFMPLPAESNLKPVDPIAGMDPEYIGSWEGIYNNALPSGSTAVSAPDEVFVMSDADYMSAVMALANETWLI